MKIFFILLILPFSLFGRPIAAKIYDCFLFYNELDILEIRLNEMYPYVDKFVLVESCETHRKAEPKPFYYEINKARFAKFADKIIHIKLEEHFESNDSWGRENWQRNQIMRGLSHCQANDIILISDVDEIVPGKALSQLGKELKRHRIVIAFQKMYRWFLNRSADCIWSGTGIIRYKDLRHMMPQDVRNAARSGTGLHWYQGWHFTSMGGYEMNLEKYQGIVEGSDQFLSKEEWRSQVNSHQVVPIDESYPQFILDNFLYLLEKNLIDTEI